MPDPAARSRHPAATNKVTGRPAPRKYPQEFWDLVISLVNEAMAEEPGLSLNVAV